MKLLLSVITLSIACCLVPSISAQTSQRAALTNGAVVKLSKAGFKEKTIISIIYTRQPNFDLTPDRMIELKRNGVGEKIIVAMLARQEGMDQPDDSWSDDSFIAGGEGLKGTGTDSAKTPNDGSTDIFGSKGGVKGSTRSRGQEGAVDEDTQTTGSATVRILRPPTEAGAGPTKLEKTPALTNDSIQELVEAGFSEGTIIRRIERSPVDFDLRVDKLDELRKRRVSDKVLAAMKTAMGNDSNQ